MPTKSLAARARTQAIKDRSTTKAAPFHHVPVLGCHLFEVRAGVESSTVEAYADLLLHLAECLLIEQVETPDADKACITKFLVDQARACYAAAGASS